MVDDFSCEIFSIYERVQDIQQHTAGHQHIYQESSTSYGDIFPQVPVVFYIFQQI